jgi:hypothetical protein
MYFFLNACVFHICEIIRFVCSLDMSDKFFGKTRLNHAPDHFWAVVRQWWFARVCSIDSNRELLLCCECIHIILTFVVVVQSPPRQNQQQHQGDVGAKQRPQTLDLLFANMKEQRMKVLSRQNNAIKYNGGGRRPRVPWARGRFWCELLQEVDQTGCLRLWSRVFYDHVFSASLLTLFIGVLRVLQLQNLGLPKNFHFCLSCWTISSLVFSQWHFISYRMLMQFMASQEFTVDCFSAFVCLSSP